MALELADLQKSNLDLQRRHVQFQHELRRRDKEFERLQVGPSSSLPCLVKYTVELETLLIWI